jgi:hypothetical protein
MTGRRFFDISAFFAVAGGFLATGVRAAAFFAGARRAGFVGFFWAIFA